jgi:hypothetical protein
MSEISKANRAVVAVDFLVIFGTEIEEFIRLKFISRNHKFEEVLEIR